MILIVLPLKTEFNTWIKFLDKVEPAEIKRFYKARLGESTVLTTYGGLGYRILRRIKEGIDNFDIDRIVHIGSAGSLNPELKVGSVVLAKDVLIKSERIAMDFNNFEELDFEDRISNSIHLVPGRILTLKTPVFSKAKAEELHKEYGADCVDMESYYVAKFCKGKEIPCLILRGISDFSDHKTPGTWKKNLKLAIGNCFKVVKNQLNSVN
ncbi:5'-methylthioadenosine/S-adenosylhomocysteine nucleosidase [bacterium]|nr:5'-methylthioadenosine/S-adenosylhomocysteine nucleosidase [bacterium]